MIPKIIHYCWFGKNQKDKRVQKCIKSWKKYFPDYSIKEWNEDNFDLNMFLYAKEAYDSQKWAFVSDVARLYALYHEGGIYFDTDVEVVRSFERILDGKAVFGLESIGCVATCVIIVPPKSLLIKNILDSYSDRPFINSDGTYDYTPNPVVVSNELVKTGLSLQSAEETNEIRIMDIEVFSPYDYRGNLVRYTSETLSIHHFSATWLPKYKQKEKKKNLSFFVKLTNRFSRINRRVYSWFARVIERINPLLGVLIQEKNIRVICSYRLSKRYSGRIIVYKNTNIYISPSATVEIRGTLRIGLNWDHFSNRITDFIVGNAATLLVKGDFRILNGARVSINEKAKLVLGNNGLLNMCCNIRCFTSIIIGDDVRISENCVLSDSDNHSITYVGKTSPMSRPIELKNHVLIGLNCTILKGVTINENAVVAACSVVTKDVENSTLVGGIPAKVIRSEVEWEI